MCKEEKNLSDVKDINRKGFCYECKRWLVLEKGKNHLPIHDGLEKGVKCIYSLYSYKEFKYFITTIYEAIAVAKLIEKDKGECLGRSWVFDSVNHGAGRYCTNTRLLLAKALAEYFLKQQE